MHAHLASRWAARASRPATRKSPAFGGPLPQGPRVKSLAVGNVHLAALVAALLERHLLGGLLGLAPTRAGVLLRGGVGAAVVEPRDDLAALVAALAALLHG